jgi:hypothetical protein
LTPDDAEAMLQRWGSLPGPVEVSAIRTGSLALDQALGVHGWPMGREIELYGGPGTGKTTLAYHALANAQALGTPLLVTGQYNAEYAEWLGVDQRNLMVTPYLSLLSNLSYAPPLTVVDTPFFAAPDPPADATVLYLTETRTNLDAERTIYGRNTRTGKLNPSVLVRLVSSGVNVLNQRQNCTAVIQRNPYGLERTPVQFVINWGKGIDRARELIEFGEKYGVISRNGNWLSLPEHNMQFNGIDNFARQLDWFPEIMDTLEQEIRSRSVMIGS